MEAEQRGLDTKDRGDSADKWWYRYDTRCCALVLMSMVIGAFTSMD